MKIYDISQEVFSCEVYPGDTAPEIKAVRRIERGDLYNLTEFSMCAHNGTHIDAPFHFLKNGKTAEQIPLEKTVGICYVTEFNGEITGRDAKNILKKADAAYFGAAKRIILKGNAPVSPDAAKVFAVSNVFLIGVESQSVGDADKPMEVHKILLEKEIVLLEGLRLDEIREGLYTLCAQPLALGGSDGAPCRAILIKI